MGLLRAQEETNCGMVGGTMAVILLIDDDETLLDVLSLSLEDAGHRVLCAGNGVDGLAALRAHQPELVISDINMPRLDGFALCRQIRTLGLNTPVLLLTSRDSEIDEALGLDLGADDYVVKPFNTRVLLARVQALLRRHRPDAAPSPPLHIGELSVDSERFEVSYQGKPVAMTRTEFRLLMALLSRKGAVCSRERLLSATRGDDSTVDARLIDTYVRRLRRKFAIIDSRFDHIETLIGFGYRWRERDV